MSDDQTLAELQAAAEEAEQRLYAAALEDLDAAIEELQASEAAFQEARERKRAANDRYKIADMARQRAEAAERRQSEPNPGPDQTIVPVISEGSDQ